MGSKILYYAILLPISLLPFRILYGISDLLYFIIYEVFGYRKKVVRTNLEKSFPEKSEKEIRQIASNFYAHLCDLVVESIKAFTISKKQAQKRMKNRNIELINQFHEQNKQVVMVGGHYGNWELYAIAVGMDLKYQPLALYTPLKNKFINQKITESRSKYGLQMLNIFQIKEKMKEIDQMLYATIFASDQSPRKTQQAYWMKFLNQETGVQFGAEKFAKKFHAAVVFGNIYKVKRGFYEVEYQPICEDASQTPNGLITQMHTRLLEKDIRKKPEHWLWSHRRWKHPRPSDSPLNPDMVEIQTK